jgi:hypothetical protein
VVKAYGDTGEPFVDLGGGSVATLSEILARCIMAGGIAAFQDVVDEIIIERRGQLGWRRRVKRCFRHRLRKPVPSRRALAVAVPITGPRPIPKTSGSRNVAFAGAGLVDCTRDDTGPIYVRVWDNLDAHPRTIATLAGFNLLPPVAPPAGDRMALVVLRDGRPDGGWCADFASCYVVDLATGDTRVLVDSTRDFVLSPFVAWSPDGNRIALCCTDFRHGPRRPSAIRVLEASTGRSLASIERREPLHLHRFDADGVVIKSDSRLYRWVPGSTALTPIPDEPNRRYVLPSGEPAVVWDTHEATKRVLVDHEGGLGWSRVIS